MFDQPLLENALAAIRVSTPRQGSDGDSPEAQREQMESFAQTQNLIIKDAIVLQESASKDIQPMQAVVDYCKDPKNDIQVVIIKSIDRFTRGGATPYDLLKLQLEKYGVRLIDIYGVISSKKVNTLEHLGLKYRWSEFSPSQKTEFLEAERAKDELRDIMSRMIGAEVRYTRLGYWMRRPPYGFESHKVDTANGKRCLLRSHPTESDFIIKMLELRCRGTLTDQQIVDEINRLGYQSRKFNVRDKYDRTKIVAQKGGAKLDLKQFWVTIQKPIYAGVICEKWTGNKPVKAKFKGLVSYETFNKANRGKITISEQDGVVSISRWTPPEHLVMKGTRSADFPYKKLVMCPGCEKPLYGSASKGGSGKYYAAYHCNKRGHYFRVPKSEFEATIADFVHSVTFSQDHIDNIVSAVETIWNKRQQSINQEDESVNKRISILQAQIKSTVDKIKFLSSESTIKYLEEDIMKMEEEIAILTKDKNEKADNQGVPIKVIMEYAKYFLEHLDYLLLKQIDPVKKANFFGVIFDKLPTYQEIVSGTRDISKITGVNELFKIKQTSKSLMVPPRGVEPLASP